MSTNSQINRLLEYPDDVRLLIINVDHPKIPFNIHHTVISDWSDYRWGPVPSKEKMLSLVNKKGYFYNFE